MKFCLALGIALVALIWEPAAGSHSLPRWCAAGEAGRLPTPLIHTLPAAAADGPDSSEPARQHFHRGIELYEERDFNGAASEFRRAYQLAPNYRVLYNLGQVSQEQHDWAAALDYFSRYLKDGAGQIAEDRRVEVEQELSKLRKRVGRLVIVTQIADADILVDGLLVAHTPVSRPLDVNLGRRRVELRAPEGNSRPQWVEVSGGEATIVELLIPAQPQAPVAVEIPAPQPAPHSRASGHSTWWAWLGTGLCAAGAAATGTLAYRWSRDLEDQRNSFPVTASALEDQQRKVRHMGWITDGLLAGTAVFAGVSIFLTFAETEPGNGLAVGPTSLWWKGTF